MAKKWSPKTNKASGSIRNQPPSIAKPWILYFILFTNDWDKVLEDIAFPTDHKKWRIFWRYLLFLYTTNTIIYRKSDIYLLEKFMEAFDVQTRWQYIKEGMLWLEEKGFVDVVRPKGRLLRGRNSIEYSLTQKGKYMVQKFFKQPTKNIHAAYKYLDIPFERLYDY